MSDGGGGGSSGGGSDEGASGGPSSGNGSQSGTALAEGPASAPNAGTVGASVGGSSTPMLQLGGGSFSASDGTSSLGGITSSGGSPASPTASIANPLGVTAPAPNTNASSALGLAPPVGFGTSATDLSSTYDPLSNGQSGGAPAPAAGATQLTPQQMGQPAAPAAGGAAPSAPAAGGSGDKSILDSLGIKNPLGAAIGAAGLGYSVLQGQQTQKYSPEMLAQAQSLNAQGQQLLSYLNSGTLPAGLQASLTQATSAAKAKVISNFASQGLNTDPTQNTALAAQLNQVDQQALISTAQIGQQLMTSGIQETGISSELYKTLANIDQTQTANIGKAIANFASSISGGSGSAGDAILNKLLSK